MQGINKTRKNIISQIFGAIRYLGHNILVEGLQPTGEKVEAVNEAPPPNKVSQLRSFLGYL